MQGIPGDETTTTESAQVSAIRRSNYVLYGLVILVLMVALGVFGYQVSKNQQLGKSNQRLAQQADRQANLTKQILQTGRAQRLKTLQASCENSNNLARKLRQLIIAQTIASKSLDAKLRALGFPSYAQRLKAAKKEAASLGIVNCKGISL